MTRATATLIVSLYFVTPVPASLDSTRTTLRWDSVRQLMPKSGLSGTEAIPAPAEASITSETEVVLDGRACSYKDVPRTAAVTKVILSTDGRTIIRIDFRSR